MNAFTNLSNESKGNECICSQKSSSMRFLNILLELLLILKEFNDFGGFVLIMIQDRNAELCSNMWEPNSQFSLAIFSVESMGLFRFFSQETHFHRGAKLRLEGI